MLEEVKHRKNPFEVLMGECDEDVNDLVDDILREVKGEYSSLSKAKSEILKCACAVLCKHVLEEAHGEYPFTDFQELIRETNLQRWQHESWYLFGSEGIKWQDDEEWKEPPFELMMEELLIKYVNWWGVYLREKKSQEERIEILSKLLGGFDVPSSQLYMQAVNFYIRPIW
jgi:hypothetical protein